MTENEQLAERFEGQRRRLRAIALRMLGSASEADDAVQEAWVRLSRSDAAAIENLGGWLTTVVSRVCLNMLQARRAHPEVPLEPELPEPVAASGPEADPEQEAELADSVGLAMLVVLDTLSPAERIAFVLHDMFGVPFEAIAPIVGRNAAAARQLASRARRRLRSEDAGGELDRVRHAELVDAFLAAAREGDFDGLLAILDPDVVLRADGTAAAIGVEPVLSGREEVAGFSRRARGAVPALLGGEPAAAWVHEGELRVVYQFEFRDGRIAALDLIGDREGLEQLDLRLAREGW